MEFVTDISELEALYGTPGEASLVKVADRLTPTYRKWIMASRFCIISTVGPEGVDGKTYDAEWGARARSTMW
ncbi:Pyridoxamine 5'-phosphate oxidase family protein [Litoreibacter arenae DSM 19593]|uniref:Pyridoxamine 5'-phosphate oxidase family protein n=1 Tax=Litoreibacter arenae DSM 19593 TaxID=1123360 RepID=S9QBH7_9RHOB|nr:Pyridoxamine 5'-phosphate oxidase family protein [Litoreibacter arenae DSM 19593]